MTRSDIIEKVKVRLDELTSSDETITHPVDNYLDPLLTESHNQLLREAPLYLLPMTSINEDLVEFGVDMYPVEYNAYVPRPSDFIRVGRFKFTNWDNEATVSITPEHPDYKVHQNTFLQGRSYRPVIIEVHAMLDVDTTLKRYLKCLNVTSNENVEYLFYVGNGDITELTDDLIDPLSWLCASKYMQVAEMGDMAKFAMQRYQEWILSNRR